MKIVSWSEAFVDDLADEIVAEVLRQRAENHERGK